MKHKRQTLSKTDDDESGKDDLKGEHEVQIIVAGCELPSDDIPDSTSSSRGMNNNTPNTVMTPNSTIDISTPTGGGGSTSGGTNAVSADSSVASTDSIDEEDDVHAKVKKKSDLVHIMNNNININSTNRSKITTTSTLFNITAFSNYKFSLINSKRIQTLPEYLV
uniref:Uncharacterized protein n=1 Tax=Anopheles coluzzii TaxID=1518534 RepID=A0A8W7Q2F6_ANOCL